MAERKEPTHQLEGFELRSLARIALFYYTCTLIMLVLAVVLTWTGLSLLGFVGHFEEFMRSIGFRDFHLSASALVIGAILLMVGAVVFLTVMTMLAAAFYNALARRQGVGLRLKTLPMPRPASGTGRLPIRRKRHRAGEGIVNGTRHNRAPAPSPTVVSWSWPRTPGSHPR